MSGITKTIRLSGGGPDTVENAVSSVLARAAETIRDIERFDIVSVGGTVDDAGVPAHYEVTLDITFVVRESIAG